MYRIFRSFMSWLSALVAVPCEPDALSAMSPRERADLPATHPAADPCGC